MPFITIHVFKGIRARAENMAICEGLKRAVKEALRIEHDNFHLRIREYEKDEMSVPAVSSELYTAIDIAFMSRRDPEDKERLYKAAQAELARFGIRESDTMIILSDPPLENWYIRGRSGLEISRGR